MTFKLPEELREIFTDLGHCLDALGLYRAHTVLTGGLASIVYRYLDDTAGTGIRPLATTDVDLVVPTPLPLLQGRGLGDLLEESGFRVWTAGQGLEKVKFYRHARHEQPTPYQVEILTPLAPPGGAGCELVEIQQDHRVQALPYLEILFEHPLEVTASMVPELGLEDDVTFQVVHPATFIVQKLLTRRDREEKRDKDLTYVYDTATLFRPRWGEISYVLNDLAADPRYGDWVREALDTMRAKFAPETAEGPIIVRAQYADAGTGYVPTEEGISRVMNHLLDQIGVDSS